MPGALQRGSTEPGGVTATTDSQGSARLFPVPPGRVQLLATLDTKSAVAEIVVPVMAIAYLLVALYVVPSFVLEEGSPWWAFVLVVAGWLVLLGAFVSPHFHRRYLMIAGAVAHVVALCHVAMLIAGFMQLYGDTSLWLALMMPVGLCPIVLALVALGVVHDALEDAPEDVRVDVLPVRLGGLG